MSEYRRGLAYTAGKKAALAGKLRTANNRQPGTIFHDDWGDGFDEGERQYDAAKIAEARKAG